MGLFSLFLFGTGGGFIFNQGGAITGGGDRFDQGLRGNPAFHFGGAVAEVDVGPLHAGHLAQGILDLTHTAGTGGAGNGEGDQWRVKGDSWRFRLWLGWLVRLDDLGLFWGSQFCAIVQGADGFQEGVWLR